MNDGILDIIKSYGFNEIDIIEVVPYPDIVKAGYGSPASKNVHALWFPEDDGHYYILPCKSMDCTLCGWGR